MSKAYARLSVALVTLGAAIAGCASMSDGFSPRPATGLVSGPEIGRCHMGGCTWFEVTSFEMVREIPNAALLKATVREGSSMHPNGYPRTSRGVAIDWSPESSDYYLFCSTRLPAVAFRDGEGLEAYRVNPGAPSGAAEYVTTIYNHVCHNGVEMNSDRATALGYGAGEEGPLTIDRPEQLFDRAG